MLLEKRYPLKTLEHAKRVAKLSSIYGKDYELVGFLHDILEDTETIPSELPKDIRDDILTLTRLKSETYFNYIQRIKTTGSERAIKVKLCDIEDHLTQKDTLKDSLKKRYLKAKKILLDKKE